MSNKNTAFFKNIYFAGITVANVTVIEKKHSRQQSVYSLTMSRVISARVRAPHISMVSSSSAASFWVST